MPCADIETGGEKMNPQAPAAVKQYVCSICGEASEYICIWCTKDACENHLCDKCKRCSDCCECDQQRGGTERQ